MSTVKRSTVLPAMSYALDLTEGQPVGRASETCSQSAATATPSGRIYGPGISRPPSPPPSRFTDHHSDRVGKLPVPNRILGKPGQLDASGHHERIDGRGYYRGVH